MVILLIETGSVVPGGKGWPEHQVDRGTFFKCRTSQVGMIRRVSAL